MSLFKKDKSKNNHEALLDQVLYKIPGTGVAITWRDSIEGSIVLGSTGSGKSSGPGRYAALAMLRAGWGGCILCSKPDEATRWIRLANETGRQKELVVFNKGSNFEFNFLQYELERDGEGSQEIISIVNALMNLNEQNRIHLSGGDGKEEPFWNNTLRRIISQAILLLVLADEEVSIKNMRLLISGCFKDDEPDLYHHLKRQIATYEDIDPLKRREAQEQLDRWIASSYFISVIERVNQKRFETIDEEQEAEMVLGYWVHDLPRVPDKTSSTIIESFMGVVEPFMTRGILKEKFSKGLSPELLPENIIKENRIVILDFPYKEFQLAAIFAATIYKISFQACMERRKIEEESNPKPVCLFIDELQTFISPMTDSLFQTTARSSWVASFYLTQSINNLFWVMGHNQPQARAKSLLGNLNLKFFCSNSDASTNQYASEMIGKHMIDFENLSIGSDMKISKSKNQRMHERISPDHFTTLRTGSKSNNYLVDAVVFKAGKVWDQNGQNFALARFDQRA